MKGPDILTKIALLLDVPADDFIVQTIPTYMAPMTMSASADGRRYLGKVFQLKMCASSNEDGTATFRKRIPFAYALCYDDSHRLLPEGENVGHCTFMINGFSMQEMGKKDAYDAAQDILRATSLEDLGKFGARIFHEYLETAIGSLEED